MSLPGSSRAVSSSSKNPFAVTPAEDTRIDGRESITVAPRPKSATYTITGRGWVPRSEEVEVLMNSWELGSRPWECNGTMKVRNGENLIGLSKIFFEDIPTWTVAIAPERPLTLKDGRQVSTVVLREPQAADEEPISVTLYVPRSDDDTYDRIDRTFLWTCDQFKPSKCDPEHAEPATRVEAVIQEMDPDSSDNIIDSQTFDFEADIAKYQTAFHHSLDSDLEIQDISIEWAEDSVGEADDEEDMVEDTLAPDRDAMMPGSEEISFLDLGDHSRASISDDRIRVNYWCRLKNPEAVEDVEHNQQSSQ